MKKQVTISEKEYDMLKEKAIGYDAIEKKVMSIYEDYDEDGNEIPAEDPDGDLSTIGEFVCRYYGML